MSGGSKGSGSKVSKRPDNLKQFKKKHKSSKKKSTTTESPYGAGVRAKQELMKVLLEKADSEGHAKLEVHEAEEPARTERINHQVKQEKYKFELTPSKVKYDHPKDSMTDVEAYYDTSVEENPEELEYEDEDLE